MINISYRGGIEKRCLNKKRFKRRSSAENYYKYDVKKRPGLWHELEPYKCEFCNGWHLGRMYRKKA